VEKFTQRISSTENDDPRTKGAETGTYGLK